MTPAVKNIAVKAFPLLEEGAGSAFKLLANRGNQQKDFRNILRDVVTCVAKLLTLSYWVDKITPCHAKPD